MPDKELVDIEFMMLSYFPYNNVNSHWLSPGEFHFLKAKCPDDCYNPIYDDGFVVDPLSYVIAPEYDVNEQYYYRYIIEPDGTIDPVWTLKNWKNNWDGVCCAEITWTIYDNAAELPHSELMFLQTGTNTITTLEDTV